MIRYRLKELMADYQFRTGQRLTFDELAKQTQIHRTTLSKIANQRSYNTTTDNIDRLCKFFRCNVGELMEYVEDPTD
ncbi:putative transcriptional regulator [Geothermobacter ehrlichii]|uniref:Putative transcriptional regulator n=1 Tax=Geothermobacter ehrlichii TaxID=213224 RepID=A0A5D3WJ00_9BACT|nr:helix-turn-helix transcriptional regulator [Geothermobacter ehrlichii]TYO96338.1 putative transcriptional regulator [Geothermobacter ehrlichii]